MNRLFSTIRLKPENKPRWSLFTGDEVRTSNTFRSIDKKRVPLQGIERQRWS